MENEVMKIEEKTYEIESVLYEVTKNISAYQYSEIKKIVDTISERLTKTDDVEISTMKFYSMIFTDDKYAELLSLILVKKNTKFDRNTHKEMIETFKDVDFEIAEHAISFFFSNNTKLLVSIALKLKR